MNQTPWYRPPDAKAELYAARLDPAKRQAIRARYFDYATTPLTNAAWAEQELQRPKSPAHHHTVHVAGKPYHWRQDYTGQLKLAAGESPW